LELTDSIPKRKWLGYKRTISNSFTAGDPTHPANRFGLNQDTARDPKVYRSTANQRSEFARNHSSSFYSMAVTFLF